MIRKNIFIISVLFIHSLSAGTNDNITEIIRLKDSAKSLKLLRNISSKTLKTHGPAALICAAIKGDIDIINLLIAKGVDVNASHKHGGTALMFAAEKGHIDVAKLLIQKGADVNAASRHFSSALVSAFQKNHINIIKLLIDKAVAECKGDIKLHVGKENPAVRLYERIGFKQKYIEMRLKK